MSRTANSDAIAKMLKELDESWHDGFRSGVMESEEGIPDWFFTKTISNLKHWELGYLAGRQAAKMLVG